MVLSPIEQAKTARCSGARSGAPTIALVLVDVGDDLVDLRRGVAELAEGPGHRLVDDRHGAPAHQLLRLDQPEVGLDAGGVAVHQQADGPGRGEHRWPGSCAPRTARRARRPRPTPRWAAESRSGGTRSSSILAASPLVHPQHVDHRLGVVVEAGERAHAGRRAGRGGVGVAGHQRGDGAGPGPALVGVVGQALGHEQGAEVGVADAELAERSGSSRRSSRSGSRRCRPGSPGR